MKSPTCNKEEDIHLPLAWLRQLVQVFTLDEPIDRVTEFYG